MSSRKPVGQGAEIPLAEYAGVPTILNLDVLQQGLFPQITEAKMFTDIT